MGHAPKDGRGGIDELGRLQLESDRSTARTTFALLLIPTLWFLRTDLTIHVSADVLGLRFAFRTLSAAVTLFAVWRLRSVADRRQYERIALAASLALTISLVALNALRPQGSVLPLRTPLMVLFALYAGVHLPKPWQFVAPLFLTAGIVVLRVFWVNSGSMGSLDGDIVVILVVNAVGLGLVRNREALVAGNAALWKAERTARETAEQTMSELRRLRGIIPICSYCREVRSEVGDWQRLDRYVREHSEAEFSHGVCPSCAKREFPELESAPPAGAGH